MGGCCCRGGGGGGGAVAFPFPFPFPLCPDMTTLQIDGGESFTRYRTSRMAQNPERSDNVRNSLQSRGHLTGQNFRARYHLKTGHVEDFYLQREQRILYIMVRSINTYPLIFGHLL